MEEHKCRFCGEGLKHTFVDLGMSPLSNSYLTADKLLKMEPFFPLTSYVCSKCFLVQLPAFNTSEEIFSDYAYFSSYSDSWLAHCKEYTNNVIDRFNLDSQSQIIEIASNDGYLLQYFKQAGLPVLGIEPAENVAKVAIEAGIDSVVEFFGKNLATKLKARNIEADLLIGNNVLAHVPDLNDFVAGLKILLGANGVISMEFPHLLELIDNNQFDTIYHEHFSYYSFLTVKEVFLAHGLKLFDVEQIKTHGGSLRIYGCHLEDDRYDITERAQKLLAVETERGLALVETYIKFSNQVKKTKQAILKFMIEIAEEGKTIVGYGAPAKGNTLLNFCGIRTDMLPYTVDRSPHKQKLFLPGTHIPIFAPEKILEDKPEFVLILPWNIKDEIMDQMDQIRSWGGRFVTFIPRVQVH
ncbi:MAG: class I SAM-dependent methyltransferase [Pseudomonadota bacterium]